MIEVQAQGIGEIERLLSRVRGAGPVVLQRVSDTAAEQMRRRVSTEKRGPDGKPWRPWSPRYARTRGSGASLLVASGALRESIRSSILGPEQAEAGSAHLYARIHHMGGKAGRGRRVTIPARPWAALSPDNVAELEDVAAGTVAGQIGGES